MILHGITGRLVIVRVTGLFVLLFLFFCYACKSNRGIFTSEKSQHERYGERIRKAGLENTVLGAAWFKAALEGLYKPADITLPYRETGYFDDNLPRSAGFRFNIRYGEKLQVTLTTLPDSAIMFTEIWLPSEGQTSKLISSADSTGKNLQLEVDKDGTLILRLQTELLQSVEYTVSISTSPSLAFPVRLDDKPNISSFWGADRDGGIRKHEGVDIFAKKRTPLLAAADGKVTRVNENMLGGKVIFMRPSNRNYTLYYAHLDSQLVVEGQEVKAGDIIGLMGNTGNARTTRPHLHFGIYTREGAVDPLPFIDRERPPVPAVKADKNALNKFLRLEKNAVIYSLPDAKSSVISKTAGQEIIKINGATNDWYRVEWNDSTAGFVREKQVSNNPLKKQQLKTALRLLHQPQTDSPAIVSLKAGDEITLVGLKNNFFRVTHGKLSGWIHAASLD